MHIAAYVRYEAVAGRADLQEARRRSLNCNARCGFGPAERQLPLSACVIKNDFPSMRTFAPDQGEDAVVLRSFTMRRALQVKVAGDQGDLRFAATGWE